MKTLSLLALFLLSIVGPRTFAEAPEDTATKLTGIIGTSKLEGAVSDLAGNFYFCNMAAEGVNIRQRGTIGVLPGTPEAEHWLTLPVGMRGNGLRIGPEGQLYMADQEGGRVIRIDPRTKVVTVLHDFSFEGLFWNNAPNDLAFSKDGRQLYVSCMKNGVWRLNRDGSGAEKVLDKYANGLDLSPDGETLVLATGFFTINADGSLTPTGTKPELPEKGYAYTDGLRCDAEGNVYVSRAGAKLDGEQQPGAVHVVSPEGKLLRNIIAPHERVHNVGFGGPDGKVLFLICPGDDGFVAYHRVGVPGLNYVRLRQWQ
ncbi:MAG: SMP-30/gluconolactonase/LRE family protein [Opitutales bacterium]